VCRDGENKKKDKQDQKQKGRLHLMKPAFLFLFDVEIKNGVDFGMEMF
jgi:hypothetical protein